MSDGAGAGRQLAIKRALDEFDNGGFRQRLADLVAVPSTSQDPGHDADIDRYLRQTIAPWLERLGFTVAVRANPVAGIGPVLTATRMEDPARPTVLTYGHADTVRGLEDQWSAGRNPWRLSEENGRWYGRGTADNKGQHALNLTALEAVLAERKGRLGFNLKLVLESAEERGSLGLRDFVSVHAEELAADVLIGSDGPRVAPETPTIATGTRGTFHFNLIVRLRPGGVHSGHWGGITPDPAIILANAIASIADRHGRILIPEWLPRDGISPAIRAVLDGCPVEGGGEAAQVDPDWGEPGLTAAEKIYAWSSFIVLAMVSGRPENPVNAVAPDARAHCQIVIQWMPTRTASGRRYGGIWTLRGLPRCRSRTGTCGCPRAAPNRRTYGFNGWHAAWSAALGGRCRSSPTPRAGCPATSSRICMARRWCGFPIVTMAANSTVRMNTC